MPRLDVLRRPSGTMPVVTSPRTATPRRYLMCPPTYFTVSYEINPWMDRGVPVDVALACRQWERLRETYLALGHEVVTMDPVPGLPDLVFAANGGLTLDGRALAPHFLHEQRQPESPVFAAALAAAGFDPVLHPQEVNEGEGDLLLVGDVLLGATGFRTTAAAHAEVERLLGRRVVSLELVDPRFYHLDTALTVLDDTTVAYLPEAFAPASRQVLEGLFPDALLVHAGDAEVLGLNAVSDGRHVVLPEAARAFAEQLRSAGFEPVGVEMGELLKSGGGAKCCTLHLRGPVRAPGGQPGRPGAG